MHGSTTIHSTLLEQENTCENKLTIMIKITLKDVLIDELIKNFH